MSAYDLLENWAERAAIIEYGRFPEPADIAEAVEFRVRAELQAASLVFGGEWPDRYELEKYLDNLRSQAKLELQEQRGAAA